MSLIFEITPFLLVGNLEFYRTKSEIQQILGRKPSTVLQNGAIEDYKELGCSVTYDEAGESVSIMLVAPAKAIFEDVNLLDFKHDDFLEWLKEVDEDFEAENFSMGEGEKAFQYTSQALGMSFLFITTGNEKLADKLINSIEFFAEPADDTEVKDIMGFKDFFKKP